MDGRKRKADDQDGTDGTDRAKPIIKILDAVCPYLTLQMLPLRCSRALQFESERSMTYTSSTYQ